jgi:VanZ family protein
MIRKILFRWGPAIAYMALIYLLSDQPKEGGVIPDFGNLDLPVKKLGHFLEFAVLALLFLRALRGTRSPTRQQLAWAFALTVLYAITDEYHQTFIPGRAGRWEDVVIDASGALLALWLCFRGRRLFTDH